MALTFVEIEDRYQTKTTNAPVQAEVIIGDAGVGGYLIFLDKELKSANTPADLGAAASVKNHLTVVSATVPDTLQETNWTSVSVIIKEAEFKTTYGPYSKEVAKHLDTACFIIKILNL